MCIQRKHFFYHTIHFNRISDLASSHLASGIIASSFLLTLDVNGKDSLYAVTITTSLRNDMKHGHHVSGLPLLRAGTQKEIKIARHRNTVPRWSLGSRRYAGSKHHFKPCRTGIFVRLFQNCPPYLWMESSGDNKA